jgi:hypothetical protein
MATTTGGSDTLISADDLDTDPGDLTGDVSDRLLMEAAKLSTVKSTSSLVSESLFDAQNYPQLVCNTMNVGMNLPRRSARDCHL